MGYGCGVLVAKRYKLDASLGRGGMGEVFQATDELLGRPVAVKLLLPNLGDPQAAERFQREARAAAMLNDPHLVAVYDFGPHDGGFFLVMELVEGGTVKGELERNGPLSKDRAIEIAEQSAAGLAVAHRHDIVHRDVKPGNLLLTPGGSVKIADFGIAHRADDAGTSLTATGQIIGSSHYLSPERARGEQGGTPSDVYALGCVLYQLVTGEPPFTAENPTGILFQHVDAAPVPPSRSRPELAGPFETVLLQMLAKDPADRPTAAEIAAGSLRAGPPAGQGASDTSPLPVVPPAPVVPLGPGSPPGNRSNKKVYLAAGAAAVLATAGIATALVLNRTGTGAPADNLGPQTGVSSSAPTNPSSTKPTDGGTTDQPATQPTRTTSKPATPTPTPSLSTTPSTTPSPTPTASSQTPTASNTPPPSSTPKPTASNTPPPDPTSSTPPPSKTPAA
jgi:serine/threonine protein kinase